MTSFPTEPSTTRSRAFVPGRVVRFFGSGLALALGVATPMLVASTASAQDCLADSVGCERVDLDFNYLDRELPSVSLDSGWVPSGSAVQVRFAFAFMGETEVSLGGTLATHWPFGLTMGMLGRPDAGTLRMAWGAEIVARLRFSVTVLGTDYDWEGNIPFIPVHDLRLIDETTFDPFVLPDARPRPVTISDTTDAIRIFSLGLGSIIDIPGVDGGFDLSVTGALTTGYQTDRIIVTGARAPITGSTQTVEYWPPTGGFGGSEDVVVRPEGTITYDGSVVAHPAVYVTVAGRRFELASFDVPIPIVSTSTGTEFDDQTAHVPLPDIVVLPTAADVGPVWIGDVVEEPFTLRNVGEAELVVTVDPTSMAIEPSSSTLVIPPSSETTLELSIAPLVAGALHETVRLRTNDPDRPTVDLTIDAEGLTPDGGTPDASFVADAGVDDADGGIHPGYSGGACGCAVPGAGTTSSSGAAALLTAVLALVLRRRRS